MPSTVSGGAGIRWTADEAVGHSLDLIVPEPQRPRHWEGYNRVMATGETRYGTDLLRVPALRAKLIATARHLPFPASDVGAGLVQAP